MEEALDLSFDRLLMMIASVSGPDSSVGIVSRYGLDGPGIERRWGGEIFRMRPDRAWGPPRLLYCGYRVFLRGETAKGWL